MKNKILLLIICILLIPCISFTKNYFISGGDIWEKGTIINKVVNNVDESDTVIFYKISSNNQYYYTTTNTIFMDTEKKNSFCFMDFPRVLSIKDFEIMRTKDQFIKEKVISQKNWKDYHKSEVAIYARHFKNRKKPVLIVYKTVDEFDVDDFNQNKFTALDLLVRFENYGQFLITEIIYVDALPEKYQIKDVELLKTGFMGGALRDSDFNDIKWDIRKKNNVSFLIVKINFNKPFQGFLIKNQLFIKIKGTYYK